MGGVLRTKGSSGVGEKEDRGQVWFGGMQRDVKNKEKRPMDK